MILCDNHHKQWGWESAIRMNMAHIHSCAADTTSNPVDEFLI